MAIAAFGTLGDVFPIVGLTTMLARHCDVIVVTSALYSNYFRNSACSIVEALSAEEHRDATDRLDLSALKGVSAYLTNYLVRSLSPAIEALQELDRQRPIDAFLGAGMINGAQWAAEILGKPYIRVSLSPFSDKEVILDELGSGVARAALKLAGLYHYFTFVDRHLNPVRRKFGLRKYGVIDLLMVRYAALRIAMYPASLLLPTSGRRPPIAFTSFPLSDPSDETVEQRTRDALGRCTQRPLVFLTGSGVTQILRDVQYAYSLCSMLGVPGIFVHSKVVQLGKRAFANLALLDFADLSCLLPEARLVVHHGGIGTIAQSLRAGIPQLVRPVAFDQMDNARRISRLRAGALLSAEQRDDVELSARLVKRLTSDPEISAATRNYRAEIARSNGLKDAVASILRFLNGSTANAR